MDGEEVMGWMVRRWGGGNGMNGEEVMGWMGRR